MDERGLTTYRLNTFRESLQWMQTWFATRIQDFQMCRRIPASKSTVFGQCDDILTHEFMKSFTNTMRKLHSTVPGCFTEELHEHRHWNDIEGGRGEAGGKWRLQTFRLWAASFRICSPSGRTTSTRPRNCRLETDIHMELNGVLNNEYRLVAHSNRRHRHDRSVSRAVRTVCIRNVLHIQVLTWQSWAWAHSALLLPLLIPGISPCALFPSFRMRFWTARNEDLPLLERRSRYHLLECRPF